MRTDKSGYYSEDDFNREFGGHLNSDDKDNGYSKRSKRNGSRNRGLSRGKKGRGSGKKNRKKTIIIVLACLVILVLAGLLIGYMFLSHKLDKVDRMDISKADLNINPKVKEELKDYKNIALLGIDTNPANGETDEKARTDAIVVMSINKKTKEIKLIALNRDSYLDIEVNGKHNIDKVNHAHHYGGPIDTIRALNRNLDLNVDDFVRVNWRTVAEITDSMGGLTLNIEAKTRQELNRCIVGSAKALGMRYWEVGTLGKVKLTGIQTVGFCRMRMADGDDQRTRRIREVVSAAFKRMKTMSLSELNTTLNLALSKIKTSMSSEDMMDMLMNINSYKISDSIRFPTNYEGKKIGGIFYDVPITLKSNVIKLHEEAFGQKNYSPTDTVLKIGDRIKQKALGKNGIEKKTTYKTNTNKNVNDNFTDNNKNINNNTENFDDSYGVE